MRYGITGASGQLGQRAAWGLLERVDAGDVVLVTRNPAVLDELAARGATVRHGDFDDPTSLPAALEGVERLLLVSTDAIGRRMAQHVAAIETAKRVGVGHVVFTSYLNPSERNPAAPVAESRGTEAALRASGLQWTILRNGVYAENVAGALAQAAVSGRFVHNYGAGRCALVGRDDCAAVAAAVLAGGHAGEIFDVTGPELLCGDELATLAADRGDGSVAAVAVDDEDYVAGLVAHAGLPGPVARIFATLGRAIREGHFAQRTNVVEDLTGRAARELGSILAAAARTGEARR